MDHLGAFFKSKNCLAIGAGFLLLGFLFGNWATLIPFIKTSYQLDDRALGLILLCLPLGAMGFNPYSAKLIARFGIQKTTVFAIFFICLTYALPLSVQNFYLLPVSMLLVGISMTMLNISINICATNFEKDTGIYIMSTCHGMFSVGLMIGSIMRSLTLLFSISETIHMFLMCSIALCIAVWAKNTLLGLKSKNNEDSVQVVQTDNKIKQSYLPKGPFLSIILISLCINLTEGSMTDWASLYMKEVVMTSPYFIGWGLFSYSAMMATGRLFGDNLIPRLGNSKVLFLGACSTFIGLMILIFIPVTFLAVVGFGLIGLGVSCGAPILYKMAANYPGFVGASGLAVMNTYAMFGFLVGPVIIGFISDWTSLKIAFCFVALLSLVWLQKSVQIKL